MANVALAVHPLIGTTQTYRPDLPDMTHLTGDYVARNGDKVIVLKAFHNWNDVEGLTIFYVYVEGTGHHTHLSERELGLNPKEKE